MVGLLFRLIFLNCPLIESAETMEEPMRERETKLGPFKPAIDTYLLCGCQVSMHPYLLHDFFMPI